MIALRRAVVGLALLMGGMASDPALAQTGSVIGAKATGFAADGGWMYEPRSGETVDLTISVDKPIYVFILGYLVVTEVQRTADIDLQFTSNMVEIRATRRTRGEATLSVKGGDGRLITVLVRSAGPRSGPSSPEIVMIR